MQDNGRIRDRVADEHHPVEQRSREKRACIARWSDNQAFRSLVKRSLQRSARRRDITRDRLASPQRHPPTESFLHAAFVMSAQALASEPLASMPVTAGVVDDMRPRNRPCARRSPSRRRRNR